jgi:thiol-disulfide isomerase/thioredoxin
VGALAFVSACGGDDDTSSATGGLTSIALPADGPDATISPDLPDAFVGLVGPVEVIGDELPLLATQDFTADPAVGTPAPVVVGLGYDGETVRIDAEAAGPTMVIFLAHWCPHCNAEIPVLQSLRDDDRIPDEVNVVGVSTSVKPGEPNFPPDQWLDDKGWTWAALADGVDMEKQTFIAANAFGVTGFPFTVLIDANGNVAARWSAGRPPSEIASLVAALPDVA